MHDLATSFAPHFAPSPPSWGWRVIPNPPSAFTGIDGETRQICLPTSAIGEQSDDTNAYPEGVAEKRVLWSIGHSNHTTERLIELLEVESIDLVVDVRSQPYSRYSGNFNKDALKTALESVGIRYRFAGESLGGRPPEDSMYDAEGHVLYSEMAESDRFRIGVDHLLKLADENRVAMMCSEESPVDCHRRLLIGRVAKDMGTEVRHIRGDETCIADEMLDLSDEQLPGLKEEKPWRSVLSVSRNTPPSSSSNP